MLSSPCHGHGDEGRIGNDLGLGHREDVPILSGKGGSPWENCLSEEAETGCAGFPGGGHKEQRDSGRTGPGMFEKDVLCRVLGAGRPPTEAQMPGWGAWAFLFVQRAQDLPEFFTPEHKVSDGRDLYKV